MHADETRQRRPVRSFVRREGRLTPAQRDALERLWPEYGLPGPPTALDPVTAFGRQAPLVLEIGFGNGESLVANAADHPERNYLGVEVYRPGVGRLLHQLVDSELSNVRISQHDAVEVMQHQLSPGSLTAIQLFFPDPWPKKRHHKRRIVQPNWLSLAASRLAPGGWLHMATDWQDYAEHMLAVADAEPALENTAGVGCFRTDTGERPGTKFEERGTRRGHSVFDLVYRRRDDGNGNT